MKRFRFDLPRGETIIAPVQGNGGLVRTLQTLLLDKRKAARREPLHIYEPEPGCVRVYPHYSAKGDGPPVTVKLEYLVGEESVHSMDLRPGDLLRVTIPTRKIAATELLTGRPGADRGGS